MPTPEAIAGQKKLLHDARATLQHWLKQATAYGGVVFAPPQTHHGITLAREQIAQAKAALRSWGIQVDDLPNDEDLAAEPLSLLPPVELPDLFPLCNNLIGQADAYNQLWTAFEAIARGPRGHIAFITGRPGYGRSALAHTVADDARAAGAAVVLARFWPVARADEETQEALWADDPLLDPQAVALEPAVAAAWPGAAAIGGRAWVRVVAQLCRVLGQVPAPAALRTRDDPAALKTLLRQAARVRPVVLVLERWDEAGPLWVQLLRDLAPEIERDLGVLVLATLTLPQPLDQLAPEARSVEYDLAAAQAHGLVERGQAQTVWLDVVTVDDVRTFIGEAERGLARRLHQIAGGIPVIIESVWFAWLDQGAVAADEGGVIRVASGREMAVNGELRDGALELLRARLAPDAPVDAALAEHVLGVAALEGPVFTAQAVARALDLEPEQVLDLLDDWLLDEDGRPGLVREVGFVDVPYRAPAERPSVYRFAYAHLWHIWARYGLPVSEEQELRCGLAEALERAYYPIQDRVAAQLVALWTAGGKPQRAEPYRARRRQAVNRTVLAWLIVQLEMQEQAGTLSVVGELWLFELRLELDRALYNAGHYREALRHGEAARQQALRWRDERREAQAAYAVGVDWCKLGEYATAHPLYERALATFGRVLGSDHPETAATLHALAVLHQVQGEYEQARPLYERALAIQERVLGLDHPSTAATLYGLARLHQNQGEYNQAHVLYERALAIQERVLGPDHPSTAGTLYGLAWLHQDQGEYEQARPLYERALAIQERVLGPDHHQTATTLHGLARLHQAQREYAKARLLYERDLAITERALGPDHSETATTLHRLASLHQDQGEYNQAFALYERALAIRQQKLGPDHPRTHDTIAALEGLRSASDTSAS
ncbi:MAG TPA: tetratricopeptide repeat protein [Roseiflexaceae bacterium]|nr:tetratricopeptide repeat protein [Roseiflexaceae bacterium]